MDTSFEPRNEEAYELYLRSVALPGVPANNKQALDMLERAVKLDPDYPPAWLALGRRYYVESRYGGVDASMMARYNAALERALSLDPNYVAAGAGLIVSRVEAWGARRRPSKRRSILSADGPTASKRSSS